MLGCWKRSSCFQREKRVLPIWWCLLPAFFHYFRYSSNSIYAGHFTTHHTQKKKFSWPPKHFQKLFSLTTPVLRRFGKSLLSLQKKRASIFHICNLGNNTTEQPLVLNVSDAPQSLFSWIVVWYIYTHIYTAHVKWGDSVREGWVNIVPMRLMSPKSTFDEVFVLMCLRSMCDT